MAGTAVAVAVVIALVLAVRLVQGAPPASTWEGLRVDPPASVQALAGPGDLVLVAQPGDTYWGLAAELVPNADPRPIVDRLIEVNGSASLQVGQRIVVPGDLVGGGSG